MVRDRPDDAARAEPAPGLREVAESWWDRDEDPVVRWSADGRDFTLTPADGTGEEVLQLLTLPTAPPDPQRVARALAEGLAGCDFPPTGDRAVPSAVAATLRAAGHPEAAGHRGGRG